MAFQKLRDVAAGLDLEHTVFRHARRSGRLINDLKNFLVGLHGLAAAF